MPARRAGDDWILRHNLFRNIATASGQTTGAAIVAHDSSSGTTVDGNTFLNCARAVAYGLDNTPEGFDHRGGIISNNSGALISDNGGGLISDNGGGLISDNGGGLSGTTKYALLATATPAKILKQTKSATPA